MTTPSPKKKKNHDPISSSKNTIIAADPYPKVRPAEKQQKTQSTSKLPGNIIKMQQPLCNLLSLNNYTHRL